MTYLNEDDIFHMSCEELIEQLAEVCKTEIPTTVDSIEEVRVAAAALSKLGPLYSYLVNMKMRANIKKRLYKKDKEKKDMYEDAIAKEAILDAYVDQVKMLYSTTSRLISVRQMINEELKHLKSVV